MPILSSDWKGVLTADNVDSVRDLLEKTLTGKFYFSYRDMLDAPCIVDRQPILPEMTVNCRLDPSEKIEVWRDGKGVGIRMCDDAGYWSWYSTATEDIFDSNFSNPYFEFSGSMVCVKNRLPNGGVSLLKIRVQDGKE